MNITVKHRTASGSTTECWEYDHEAGRVRLTIRQGSRYLDLAVLVCSRDRPVVGAHPIMRVNSESWRILPPSSRLAPNEIDHERRARQAAYGG